MLTPLSLSFLIIQLPEKLISKYNWIKQWKLGLKFKGKNEDLVDKIKESLTLLRKKVRNL